MAHSEPVKIVVVGGSFAGITIINTLLASIESSRKNIQITLIERRDARHHSVGAFRALVDEQYSERIWIPYTNLFPADSPHKIIQDRLVEVHHDHIVLVSGESVAFDYLALCTGSSNPSPAKFNVDSSQEAKAITNQARADLKKSKNIVVVGGGACGVEFAGEIKTAFPDKNVTLLHATSTLVDYPGYADNLKSLALTHLTNLGVEVILNEKATIEDLDYDHAIQVAPRSIRTHSGKIVESDMQFLSVGIRVDTSYMSTLKPVGQPNFDPQTLINPHTHTIKVQSTHQVNDFDNIFAVGDCSDFSKVPTAAGCSFSGPAAAKNIISLIRADEKKTKAKLANGGSAPAIMCLTTGPKTGITSLPLFGTRFSNFFSTLFKSKDLMIGSAVSSMNIK
ncbi:Apoptosis-inducing factor 2 [Modicella reniformis]|uniref:Apoptosis-inducing factor 2 n=1 Tax=Modicella reniformis TaxID=1440133 RepID=A0A9P6LTC5_9FUNG|nr:Apoptosis-inducing factor 2 [Modicella reniformis]